MAGLEVFFFLRWYNRNDILPMMSVNAIMHPMLTPATALRLSAERGVVELVDGKRVCCGVGSVDEGSEAVARGVVDEFGGFDLEVSLLGRNSTCTLVDVHVDGYLELFDVGTNQNQAKRTHHRGTYFCW